MGDIKNKMKDIILIVKYNYAEHLGSVGFLKDLYQDHFKKIIFYSDIGENKHQQDEVNFVETKKGAYTQNIFWHAESSSFLGSIFYYHLGYFKPI